MNVNIIKVIVLNVKEIEDWMVELVFQFVHAEMDILMMGKV